MKDVAAGNAGERERSASGLTVTDGSGGTPMRGRGSNFDYGEWKKEGRRKKKRIVFPVNK